MIWGLVVATYSSVFICSPMLIYLGLRNEGRSEAPADSPETSVAALESTEADGAGAPAAPAKAATPRKSGKGASKRSSKSGAKS
jgi:preprotein translocase subunit SecF